MRVEIKYKLRLATLDDMDELTELMNGSIRKYLAVRMTPEQVEASFELMGMDTDLIIDQTLYVAENDQRILGCGGWSRRATLFGSDHTPGRNPRLLDPKREGARIRAMYTHPEHGKMGVGSGILAACEAAAYDAGFRDLNLMSTLAGERLYLKHGYSVLERLRVATKSGPHIPLARMTKNIRRIINAG